jgi:hypothetical protein
MRPQAMSMSTPNLRGNDAMPINDAGELRG